MYYNGKIWIGDANGEKVYIEPKMANRHGLIAGATGTGKTITLKVLAESFSDAGVPVFLADIKGDLAGMCRPGVNAEDMQKRIRRFGLDQCGFTYKEYPTTFWDLYGEMGIPVRTTVSEMGPVLLSKLMDLNDTQADILTIVFKIADDQDLLLLDTKDLKAMLQYVGEHADELSMQYGRIAKVSVTAILRSIVALEAQGADRFFCEPALNITDWFATGLDGRGMINVLDSRELVKDTKLYSTFLLWMLSELFDILPEVGDLDKPRMVFFFDEAHLLFKDISKALRDKIEQVVKLIRSKGVGVYFITQSPRDVPDEVLAQLGNKIQHCLHAYTPTEEKAVKAAAGSFRVNPAFDTFTALQELGVGEALVSVLDEKGIPCMTQRCKILPPQSQMGPIPDEDKKNEVLRSNLGLRYQTTYDRDSAYEFLQRLNQQLELEAFDAAQKAAAEKEAAEAAKAAEKEAEAAAKAAEREAIAAQKAAEREAAAAAKAREREEAAAARAAAAAEAKAQKEYEAALKKAQQQKEREEREKKKVAASIASTAGGTVGREVGNAIGKTVGGAFGKKLGGNIGAALGRGILGTLFKK